MLVPDVNVLIYAHRTDSCDDHEAYASWLTKVATGLVRIVTNPRIFRRPSTLDDVFAFVNELTARPNARVIHPGPRHLEIFEDLCRRSGATAKLAADAQHAAVAIEHGCTLITTDSDFDRFPGLRWRHPMRKH